MTVTPEDICAREPIHQLGTIQPHGVLISVAMPDWTVRHVSTNVQSLFDVPAKAMLGESLRDYIDDRTLAQVSDAIAATTATSQAVHVGSANIGVYAQLCEVSTHIADDMVHLEIEPQVQRLPTPLSAQTMIARLPADANDDDFDQCAVEQIRQLTGLDRVMLYRFRADGAGEVVAEHCDDTMEPYLGLRYPASDIPAQARLLYLHNRIRLIADVHATPVSVIPGVLDAGAPIDMGRHVLRSVSPVHIEYLRNMGVGASMSLSIVAGGRLWGLIACHHRTARVIPPSVREQAELFTLFVSMRIAAREQLEAMASVEHAQQMRDRIAARMDASERPDDALVEGLADIMALFRGDGALLLTEEGRFAHGRVPRAGEESALRHWMDTAGPRTFVQTDSAAPWGGRDGLAGVMAMRIGSDDAMLFVFRAEQVEDVRWAGNPQKAISTDDGIRMAPRASFAEWRQTVRGTSVPFTDADMRVAERLARMLRDLRRGLRQRDAVPSLDEHRRQLDMLSSLLPGLVHLDADQARALGDQIAQLQAQIQSLIHPEREH